MSNLAHNICGPDDEILAHGGHAQGTVPGLQLGVAGALLAGCAVASTTLWYYSRRYVGELALRPDRPGRITVSVLDFWGNREVIALTAWT